MTALVQPARRELPGGAALVPLPSFRDPRGSLSVAELDAALPFLARRVFFVSGVPSREVRGKHAHRRCQQFLVATHGSLSVIVDDGHTRQDVLLDTPRAGIHIPVLVWAEQLRFSADAALAVLASDAYDPDDYINDYEEFRRLAAGR